MISGIAPAAFAERCGALWCPQGDAPELTGLTVDSRKVLPGDLFVAVKGEQVDGHDYVAKAQAQGASAALVQRRLPLAFSQLVAEDTEHVLAEFAAMTREAYEGVLVGITGSAGKTTAKNMLCAVLGRAGTTMATEGNLNNELGVPLTLARLAPQTEFAVLELGAGKPGDIAYLCDFVKPNVAVLLNVGPAHLAQYDSLDAIADTKGAILDGLPDHGLAVINGDQHWSALWRERVQNARCVTFGMAGANDYQAREIESAGFTGSAFWVESPTGQHRFETTVAGRQGVYNALAAIAVASELGVSTELIQEGLLAVRPASGRGDLHTLDNGCRLVNDSYNANPLAVHAAIDVLAKESGRRRLVLGPMLELGAASSDLHREVGAIARQNGIEELWAIGDTASPAIEGFAGAGATFFASNAALLEARPRLEGAEITLVKGSRGARLEEIVTAWLATGVSAC